MNANNIFDEKLGLRLRQIRKEHKLSMNDVGKKIGCTKQMISLYELGKSALSVEQLKKICSIYDIKYYDIIKEVGKMIDEI